MGKQKYIYDKTTLQYRKYQAPLAKKLQLVGLLVLLLFAAAFGLQYFMGLYFPSVQEQRLTRELNQMKYKYSVLNQKMDIMNEVLSDIHQKDQEVHSVIFGRKTMDDAVWNGGVGGHEPGDDIIDYSRSGSTIKKTQQRLDKLERQLALQSRSLDTIYHLAMNKEKMIASIPSIKPVKEDKLKYNLRHLSGYGWRIHPIHKVKKLHKGIDFTAPRGTPIQASGDGKVIKVKNLRRGYGKHVIIDHGYGYESLYAHMSKIFVKVGDRVKRGQKIGEVGSSGTSTAPHLHYEIHLNGRALNPIHFCMDGLTPNEYEVLVERAAVENQSFD